MLVKTSRHNREASIYWRNSFLLALLMGIFLASPHAMHALGRQETTMIWLEPYRVPVAVWDGPWMADHVTFQDGEVLKWIWGIEGFDEYEWGMAYVLRVRIIEETERIPDRPQRRFKLVKVLSRFKPNPGESFTLPLADERFRFLEGSVAEGWSLMDEAPVDLAGEIDPFWLEGALSSGRPLAGLFRSAPEGHLELLSVEGSD